MIELDQQTQIPGNTGGATVNSGIRYSVDGGTTWMTRTQGDLLGPNKDESEMQFSDPDVKLTVNSPDVSTALPTARRMYNVYVYTNEYDGARGQCVEDQLRRRLRQEDNSGGVPFPTNPLVTKEEATKACASLGSQMDNCVTDVRMANSPKATSVIAQVFVEVESVLKQIEETIAATESGGDDVTTTTTTSSDQTTGAVVVADATAVTIHMCVSMFVMLPALFV